jgi:hypothetical protein
MFIPSRNVWHPLGRKPAAAPPPEPLEQAEPPPDAAALTEPAEFHEEPEPDAWDEADELASMSDQDFYRQTRAQIDDVREGSIPCITGAMRPRLQDRPWSKRHKIRDRRGVVY